MRYLQTAIAHAPACQSPTIAGMAADRSQKRPTAGASNEAKKTAKVRPNRPVYTEEQKQVVKEQYHLCITRADKVALQERLGFTSIEQLYNLANRLNVTRTHRDDVTVQPRSEEAFAPERLRIREDPDTVEFSPHSDDYLSRHFGPEARTRRHIEEIAFHLGHSETSIMYRARHLGLRTFCKYWQDSKIVAWTGLDADRLRKIGVDFFPCIDRDGKLAITLVSTSSLLRLIAATGGDDHPEGANAVAEPGLVDRREELLTAGIDLFFLRELDELRSAVLSGAVRWERSRWVSHSHVCLNPWAGLSFMLFDDGRDHKVSARGLHPADLHPSLLSES